jgi:hypothetical protein
MSLRLVFFLAGYYFGFLVSYKFRYHDSVKDGFCYLLHPKDYFHFLKQPRNWFSRNKIFRGFCLQFWQCNFQLHPGVLLRRQLEQQRPGVWKRPDVRRLELVSREWFDYPASIVVVFRGCAPPPPAQQIGKANEDDASDATHNATDNCSRMSWLGCWNRTCSGSGRCTCSTGA